MERRKFLRSAAAVSTVAAAGCPGEAGDGTETVDPGESGGTETDGSTDSSGTDGETTADGDAAPPRLHTDGKWVVDEDGNEVTLRGVNLVEPTFADDNAADRGADHEESLELALDESAGWYNRVLRLPITQYAVDEMGLEALAEEYLDPTVARCGEAGTYLIIDLHLIQDWQDETVHEQVETFWEFVAPRYADEPHVLYEFFNEPDAPADNTLENWNAWKEVAQPWVDMIREHAPETPIVVGSPQWTSLTKWAAESPFEGENLIYAGHIYPGDGRSAEAWDEEYGAPADDVPVMITEWGYDALDDVQPGTTSGWGDPFREWLDGRENVGWTAWCFDSHWEPTMVDFDFNPKGGENFHGWFVKEWLFEKRNDRVPPALASGEDATFEGPTDEDGPPAPGNLELTENDDGSVTLAWDHAPDEETRTVHYDVYVDGDLRTQEKLLVLVNEQADGDFTADEYRFETRLQGLTPGETYEFYVQAVDSLSNASPPSRFVEYAASGELEVHAEIGRTDSAPEIDAESDDGWADRAFHEFQHVVIGEPGDESDLGGGWRATWDDDALYVLVDVTDQAFGTDSDEAYNNDAVEIYVDADNSKLPEYDGENDFQIVFEKDADEIQGTLPRDLSAASFAQAETDDGWRVEVALPWSALGVADAVEAGHLLGFDVHVNDDDSPGERDKKINWFNEEDDSWENPAAFANVELTD